MKQILKKIFSQLGIWDRITSDYHSIRRYLKHAVLKKRDFKQYVYPVIGKHPAKNDVFLVLSPTYKNLGDHAIAKATMDLLTEWGIVVREVSFDIIKLLAKHHDYAVFGQSTVLVTGGGYLGTLWPHMHEMTSRIIEENPEAKIVILPNTLYFDQTPDGEKLFQTSLKVFNQPNVKRIYLREKLSYDMVNCKYMTAKLMPDIVMRMNDSRPGAKRSGCLICLRNDKERTLTEAQATIVYDSIRKLFGNAVSTTDMRNDLDIPLNMRTELLEKKFNEFRHAELVVTDRLHGMIFSAITGTPCIVMNSRSHKLIGCYEWLQHIEYIRFCSDAEEICNIYTQMPHGAQVYDETPLAPWFEEMKAELTAIVRE